MYQNKAIPGRDYTGDDVILGWSENKYPNFYFRKISSLEILKWTAAEQYLSEQGNFYHGYADDDVIIGRCEIKQCVNFDYWKKNHHWRYWNKSEKNNMHQRKAMHSVPILIITSLFGLFEKKYSELNENWNIVE